MTLKTALAKSNQPIRMAKGSSAKGREILASISRGEFRIIKGVTDPTVIRRLTPNELGSINWDPVITSEGWAK